MTAHRNPEQPPAARPAGRRRARLALLSVLIAVHVAAAPAIASAPFGGNAAPAAADGVNTLTVWEVLRTTAAASELLLDVEVSYDDSRALIAIAALRDSPAGPRPVAQHVVTATDGTADPEVYAAGAEASCANPPSACVFTNEGRLFAVLVQEDGGITEPDAATRLLVGTLGTDPRVTASEGWTVRPARSAGRAVFSGDAGATAAGAGQFHSGAEVFLAAAAAGGRQGSVALGVPPCLGVASAKIGVGTGTLSDGRQAVANACPTDFGPAVAATSGAAKWSFTGTYAGLTAPVGPGRARLVVLDLPRAID